MQLEQYYSDENDQTLIHPEQASRFAKKIANDFNPIHDPDSPRFCVPGDLLFAIVLKKYGLSQKMQFDFAGMITDATPVQFPKTDAADFSVKDANDKAYLHVIRNGDMTTNPDRIENLTKQYVAFSGKNFPDLIVPLMQEHGVMIHPDRPLVIYESMQFDLQNLDFDHAQLELSGTSLEVTGKKGKAHLNFTMRDEAGEIIGSGSKRLALRGLVSYEQSAIDEMVSRYEERRVRLAA